MRNHNLIDRIPGIKTGKSIHVGKAVTGRRGVIYRFLYQTVKASCHVCIIGIVGRNRAVNVGVPQVIVAETLREVFVVTQIHYFRVLDGIAQIQDDAGLVPFRGHFNGGRILVRAYRILATPLIHRRNVGIVIYSALKESADDFCNNLSFEVLGKFNIAVAGIDLAVLFSVKSQIFILPEIIGAQTALFVNTLILF